MPVSTGVNINCSCLWIHEMLLSDTNLTKCMLAMLMAVKMSLVVASHIMFYKHYQEGGGGVMVCLPKPGMSLTPSASVI